MNLEEEKEFILSKKSEFLKLHRAGVIDTGQMLRVQRLMVSLGIGLDALDDEELSKSGISSASVLRSMDEAKNAFMRFDQELKAAYRELLKEKLKELEKKPNE